MKTPESFFLKVYKVALKIPYGRVTSYGAIAEYLGTRGSARMVGWAMNASHTMTGNIPAHRVVNRNGVLTGKHHFGGPRVMQQLLESEGIEVVDDKIVDFDKVFWDPAKHLTPKPPLLKARGKARHPRHHITSSPDHQIKKR